MHQAPDRYLAYYFGGYLDSGEFIYGFSAAETLL